MLALEAVSPYIPLLSTAPLLCSAPAYAHGHGHDPALLPLNNDKAAAIRAYSNGLYDRATAVGGQAARCLARSVS